MSIFDSIRQAFDGPGDYSASDPYYKSPFYINTKMKREDMEADRGARGEYLVTRAVSDIANRGAGGYVYNNVIIPLPNGSKSEIDVIYLSRLGIHCIEVKNRSGNLSIMDDQDHWLIGSNNKNYEYRNPLRQNMHHINNLTFYLSKETAAAGNPLSVEKIFNSIVNVCVHTADTCWSAPKDLLCSTPYFFGQVSDYRSIEFEEFLTDEEVSFLGPMIYRLQPQSAAIAKEAILSSIEQKMPFDEKFFFAEEGSSDVPGTLCMEDNNGYTYFYDRFDHMFKANHVYRPPKRKSKRYGSLKEAQFSSSWHSFYCKPSDGYHDEVLRIGGNKP